MKGNKLSQTGFVLARHLLNPLGGIKCMLPYIINDEKNWTKCAIKISQ